MKIQKKILFHTLRILVGLLIIPQALLFAHHLSRGSRFLALLMAVCVVGSVGVLLMYTVPKDGHGEWPKRAGK